MNSSTTTFEKPEENPLEKPVHWLNGRIKIKTTSDLFTATRARLDAVGGKVPDTFLQIVLGNLLRENSVYRTRSHDTYTEFELGKKFELGVSAYRNALSVLADPELGIITEVLGYKGSTTKLGSMSRGWWLSLQLENKGRDWIYSNTFVTKIQHEPDLLVYKGFTRPADYEREHEIKENLKTINAVSATWSLPVSAGALWIEKYPRNASRFLEVHATVVDGVYSLQPSSYYRVFEEPTLRHHGRFYAGVFSNMPFDVRDKLMINGESTVEIDFSSTHLRILYSEAGTLPIGDLYSLPPVNGTVVSREIWKRVAVVCIGASSTRSATKALSLGIVSNTQSGSDPKKDGKASQASQGLRDQTAENGCSSDSPVNTEVVPLLPNGITCGVLRTKFMEHHTPIQHLLCTGQSLRLMGVDSRIAERVLLKLSEQGIACHCLHDSFRVQVRHQAALETAMREAWLEELPGGCPSFAVKSRNAAPGLAPRAVQQVNLTREAPKAVEALTAPLVATVELLTRPYITDEELKETLNDLFSRPCQLTTNHLC